MNWQNSKNDCYITFGNRTHPNSYLHIQTPKLYIVFYKNVSHLASRTQDRRNLITRKFQRSKEETSDHKKLYDEERRRW